MFGLDRPAVACAAIVVAVALSLAASPALAATGTKKESLQDAGKIVATALPVAAGSVSLLNNDWHGIAQLVLVTGLTVGTAYGLKRVVHEERPDHSDSRSFPSDQAVLAFAPAAYLWDRYGWEYGVPAYAAAGFVGYARVESDRHHWWDVVASAGIGWIYSRLITREYRPPQNFYTGAYVTPHAAFVTVDYRF